MIPASTLLRIHDAMLCLHDGMCTHVGILCLHGSTLFMHDGMLCLHDGMCRHVGILCLHDAMLRLINAIDILEMLCMLNLHGTNHLP